MKYIAGICLLIILQLVASQGPIVNIPNCAAINPATGLCNTCAQRFYLQQDRRACLPCSISCLTCTNSATTCTSCEAGRYFQFNTCPLCMANCASCSVANTCNQCRNEFYKYGVACYPCLAGCAVCSNNSQCITCLSSRNKRTVNGLDVCDTSNIGVVLIILWIVILLCCCACCIGACVWFSRRKSATAVHESDPNYPRDSDMHGPGVTEIYHDQSPQPGYYN